MSSPNHLAQETSPYLLQHKDNPVDWYPWGEEALQKAKAEQKPIFLSIGYSACHWCHVMEHESFENPEIAALMNEHFVSIKVDREERPDLDEIYMNAVQLMTGQGGWPMSVFLTPDLKPFYGGTYFPPHDMYGRPGFVRVLSGVARAFREQRQEIEESAEQMVENLQHSFAVSGADAEIQEGLIERACREMIRRFDERYGGFGGAPKFPHSMDIALLLRYARRTGDAEAQRMAGFSLERMARGGIYDQVGGGFHRYATDERWLIPHFEKMLYDNALLAKTYCEAWQFTKHIYFKKVVKETLDYVLREMTSPEGGFYSTQDADSEGEEGKYFVWTPEEIFNVLGEEKGKIACRYYGVETGGNFEHGSSVLSIPNEDGVVEKLFEITSEALVQIIKETNCKLFARRAQRVKPGRDEKVLTDWNGLMISAMAFAGNALGEKRYVEAAEKAAELLLKKLWDRYRTRLLHVYKDEKAHTDGFLSDYANVVLALLDTYEASQNAKWLLEAETIARAMIERFWDEQDGAFFFTGHGQENLIARSKNAMDNALPSGNSIAILCLLRLAEMTGKEEYREKGMISLRVFSLMMDHVPVGFTQMLSALDFHLAPPKEIVLAGESEESVGEMKAAIFGEFIPNKVVLYATNAQREALGRFTTIVEGKTAIKGTVTAYVCENYSCRQPVTTVASLKQELGL